MQYSKMDSEKFKKISIVIACIVGAITIFKFFIEGITKLNTSISANIEFNYSADFVYLETNDPPEYVDRQKMRTLLKKNLGPKILIHDTTVYNFRTEILFLQKDSLLSRNPGLQVCTGTLIVRNETENYIKNVHLLSSKIQQGFICKVPTNNNRFMVNKNKYIEDNFKEFRGDVELGDIKPNEIAFYNLYSLISWDNKDLNTYFNISYDDNKTIKVYGNVEVLCSNYLDWLVTDTVVSSRFIQYIIYFLTLAGLYFVIRKIIFLFHNNKNKVLEN